MFLASRAETGVSPEQSEAVSLASVRTIVVETVHEQVEPADAASAETAPIQATQSSNATAAPTAEPPSSSAQAALVAVPSELEPSTPPALPAARTALPTPVAAEWPSEPADRPTQKTEATPERRPKAASKGGVAAKGEPGATAKSGAVSASQGDLAGYAARVRLRVATNKPAGNGERGTVVVTFAITPAGRVGYARVARSSGSERLDRAAVSAVQLAAPFPEPPAGATGQQLAFTIPFHFN